MGPEGRAPVLRRFAEGIRSHAQQLAAVETVDNGSLLLGNVHRMVPRAAHNIEFFADWALKLEHTIDGPEVTNHVRYEPAGVAALITPWNAPLMLTTWKVGPALAAGNTVVVKPPEWAPLTCSLLADIANEAGVPAGVLNVVQGIGEEAGAALVAHGDVDRISFTGSPETGRLIGVAGAPESRPGERRARRKVALHRLRRCGSRRRRPDGGHAVSECRPSLPRRHATAGPGRDRRRLSRAR